MRWLACQAGCVWWQRQLPAYSLTTDPSPRRLSVTAADRLEAAHTERPGFFQDVKKVL